MAKDLYPAMEFRLLEKSDELVNISIEGREIELSAIAALNVTAEQVEELTDPDFADTMRLSDLAPGSRGAVVVISRASRGISKPSSPRLNSSSRSSAMRSRRAFA